MLRTKKLQLVCLKPGNLPSRFVILPAFFGTSLYYYNGGKLDRIVVASIFMCFFYITDFILTKRLGSVIHAKDVKRKKK